MEDFVSTQEKKWFAMQGPMEKTLPLTRLDRRFHGRLLINRYNVSMGALLEMDARLRRTFGEQHE